MKERLAIVVGGGPAPGINGVISAATIAAINEGKEVIGILERELTELALAESNDMQTKAAKELGISFRQIRYLISKYKREKINPKD